MKKIKINPKNIMKLIFKNLDLLFLLLIVYIGIYIRLGTLSSEIMLDYDPWWYFRFTKYLLDNNFQKPEWDLLSFFPPGRPVVDPFGWEYIVAISYKLLSSFFSVDFMRFCMWSPAIASGLIAIPAYLTGRIITNKWGGLTTAFFAVTTPTLVGVSMAGYMDTDALVFLLSFAAIFSLLYALEKRTIFSHVLAISVLWLFAFSWAQSWYILDIFFAFLIIYFVGSIVVSFISKKVGSKEVTFFGALKENVVKFKPYFITLIIIAIGSTILAMLTGRADPITSLIEGFSFLEGEMIVNVSIAELQPINILTQAGFIQVASRTGISIYFALVLPIIILIKLKLKQKITFAEMLAFVWLGATFYLILYGVRFSLIFACATATAGGFVVGNLSNLTKIWKSKGSLLVSSTVFGFIILLLMMELSTALQQSYAMRGMEVGPNWVGMLDWLKDNADEKATVATWWDPGHIIAGYTGLRVHADGAHCPPHHCIPYSHNTRIQNMGRIMSTSDESEAVNLLDKYMELTPEQCQEVKQEFGDIVPEEACEPASELYFISSNDLIGKFTWMNYFGGFRAPINSNADFLANPGVCCAATPKTEPGQISCGEFADQGRGVWIWCPWIFGLSDVTQDEAGNPIYIYDYSGLTIALVQKDNQLVPIFNNRFVVNHLTFFPQGQEQTLNLSGMSTNLEKIDGLIWIDPSFRSLLYFAPAIKNSVFVRTFFYSGEGLEHFELVYSNPEIKLYRVNFD